jgi:gliding motility-associated-like protein
LRIAVLFCLLIPSGLFAQHFSKLGRFSIDYEKGCAPTIIHITQYAHLEKPRAFYLELHLDSINPIATDDTLYTYNEVGTYKIVQLIGETISPKTDTLIFTIVASPPPDFDIYSCNGNQIEVNITDVYYDFHRVYFSNSDSIDIKSGDQNPQFQYLNQNASIKVKGLFEDAYIQNCGENSKTIQIEQSLLSPTIDTAYFYQNCDDTYSLYMELNNISDFKYVIEIEDDSSRKIIFEGGLDNQMTFENVTIKDRIEQCLHVLTENPCTGQRITLEPYCINTDLTEIGNFYGAYASYSGSNMLVHFGNTNGATIKVERSNNGQTIRLPNKSTPETLDPVSSSRNYSYSLSFEDANCDTVGINTTLTAPFISILTKGQFTNRISLNVIDPINNLNQTDRSDSILLYDIDSTITIVKAYNDEFSLEPSLGELQKFRLVYHYPENGITIYSNEILTRINFIIFVPKAFTPYNNDGLNDRLLFFGVPGSKGLLQIYNRWGEKIYESPDIARGWDGRTKEGRVPQGTYRYKLSFNTPSGELISQVGTFVLIRD